MEEKSLTDIRIEGRILGLDIGEKRIGIAMSDPLGIIASPLTQINRTGTQPAIEAILELIGQHGIVRIVAGLPYSNDGSKGKQAELVGSFLKKLSERLDIPLETWDERFTTVAARDKMIEAGIGREKGKGKIDAIAAAVILQDYLDTMHEE